MKKTVAIPIMGMVLAGLVFAASCKKEKNGNTNVATETGDSDAQLTEISFTPCTHHNSDKGIYNPDSVVVSYRYGSVTVTHYNLTVTCGFTTVGSRITKSNDTIRIVEYDDGMANCICETNHTFRINNIKGRWTLILENCNPMYCHTYNFY